MTSRPSVGFVARQLRHIARIRHGLMAVASGMAVGVIASLMHPMGWLAAPESIWRVGAAAVVTAIVFWWLRIRAISATPLVAALWIEEQSPGAPDFFVGHVGGGGVSKRGRLGTRRARTIGRDGCHGGHPTIGVSPVCVASGVSPRGPSALVASRSCACVGYGIHHATRHARHRGASGSEERPASMGHRGGPPFVRHAACRTSW